MNLSAKLFTAGSLALALGACATQPTEVAEKSADEKSCVTETGTRIESAKKDCQGPGRTYTREDIERTGGISTSEALRRLGTR
jgi:outer membrane cobalamin receptor